ncbi:MAG: AAA family ATPase [Thermoguttaceae bacterium]|nr:AAA family ATPase [Thermoguttaceae bacterium]
MSDLETLKKLNETCGAIKSELSRAIVGQEQTIDALISCLLCGGNCLLTGVPGLAKTLLVRSLAQTLNLSFSRIQFTPDLMPSDIIGTEILQEDKTTRSRSLKFQQGPLFANLVLADEINRTPPKTQAALLEAMQEGQATVGGQTYSLPKPFFVLATQNPIEQGGTYPLPEAQLDRFMFNVPLTYPNEQDELEVILRCQPGELAPLKAQASGELIRQFQKLVRSMPIDEQTARRALNIVRQSRPEETSCDAVRQYVRWGAGPRAGQYLVLAARAAAAMDGRVNPLPKDVKRVAPLVMRHRIVLNFHAEAENVNADEVVKQIIDNG